MHAVLIIESSATLRHALQRLLSAHDYDVRLVSSYSAGLAELKSGSVTSKYRGIVVGLPAHTPAKAQEILTLLKRPEHQRLAVLLLVHAPEPSTFDWVARRPHTALLSWDDYGDCFNCLTKLLTPTPVSDAPTSAQDNIRVLFVDDSRTVRASFRRLLDRNGYMVDTAANATEALEKARQAPFDIAIVDYFMPGGNGDTLCRALRDDPHTTGITTAIITGTYLDEVIKDSLAAGAVECMFKNEADELFLTRLSAMSRSIRINKSVETERQRLAGILGSVGDGVYGVNKDGQITFINPAARNILGLENGNWSIGRSAHKLFHFAYEDGKPNPPETCFLQQAYAAGDELKEWETVFWNRAGKPVPIECTVFPLRIEGRLEGSVVAFRDVSERRLLERELLWQANHDSLTKLFNRNHFERQLEAEVSRLKRSQEVSALLYIDLDRFKYINDTAGHVAGDQLLTEIGQQLQARLREADMLARLGGDEFAIILRNVSENNILAAAEGFREILEDCSFVYGDKNYKINGSIGVALISKETHSPGEVLSNADIACHIAKSRGRNQTHLYRAGNDEKIAMHLELGWSVRLQDALKNDRFLLHYQPIVATDAVLAKDMPAENGKLWEQVIGGTRHYEVLVRFLDNKGGIISPNAFLPTAERFGLMPQIDVWVLTNALRKLAELDSKNTTFTINISGQTLDANTLVPLLKRLLHEYNLDSTSLIFEITETSAIANIEAAKRLINELRDLGCRFALDDFGSGFSSFYHLKHLPVDFIKIDGQFVQGMAHDPTDRAIVNSINDIAHSFGKRTVAEFVENPTILSMLQKCGVDFAQGYYISSPQADVMAVVERLDKVRRH